MFPIANAAASCVRSLRQSLNRLSIGNQIFAQQTRDRITLPRPKLRNPVWFVRKNRVVHNDQITPENQGFIKEIIHDTYGIPSIIKGVQTYKTKDDQLIENIPSAEWTPTTRRTGAIARKIGQYPLWLKDGKKIRTTLLQIVDNQVVKYTPPEEFQPSQVPRVKQLKKYGCLLVGAESTDPSMLTKEYCGLFRESGVMPKKILARFIVSPSAALKPGTPINVNHFRVGDFVDVRGNTVDHGFQGVCKRHGFKGMPASHGVTKTHRRPGNIGSGGVKARVMPGTKMPGHMGNRWRIAKGLKIWRINTKYNVMWVTGSAIPGETNNMVYIFDTILPTRKPKTPPPFPTAAPVQTGDNSPLQEENIWDEKVHDFTKPTIFYTPES